MFGDILQHDYIDSYRNLSLKRLASIEWQARRCPNAHWTVKADDDVFVNVYRLIEFYIYYNENKLAGFFCKIKRNGEPLRNSTKWMMDIEEYEPDVYPDYCQGYLTICSLNESRRLFEAAKTARFLWIEDVFTGGVLRQKAGITLNPFLRNFPTIWNIRKLKHSTDYRKLVAFSLLQGRDAGFWTNVSKQITKHFELYV